MYFRTDSIEFLLETVGETKAAILLETVGETKAAIPSQLQGSAIAMTFKYEYKEGRQDEVDALLDKLIVYYREKGEYGPVLTNFKFEHVEGGYSAVESFPNAAAYETHATNTLACPILEELMGMAAMITETEAIVHGVASEVAAAPSIAKFYPTAKRVEERPDLAQFGTPCFGWQN